MSPGRRFLAGSAVAFVTLIAGLDINTRFPDRAGPGEETVSIHGLCIFRRTIELADVGRHSPIPALATAYGTIIAGAIAGGLLAVGVVWAVERVLEKPAVS